MTKHTKNRTLQKYALYMVSWILCLVTPYWRLTSGDPPHPQVHHPLFPFFIMFVLGIDGRDYEIAG
ncbi:hypothetical protein HanIR_Chr12g0566391 [Helianthus annuus]|nr:hypothetical protein HanIR_Chr12g0566391 [Helianthus annuus]